MDFGLTEEQAMIVDTTRAFVEAELYPHEQMVERTGQLPMELIREIQQKAMAAGLYAANMPVELGGAGLDTLSWLLYEKELGKANYALHWTTVARPSNILVTLIWTAWRRNKRAASWTGWSATSSALCYGERCRDGSPRAACNRSLFVWSSSAREKSSRLKQSNIGLLTRN